MAALVPRTLVCESACGDNKVPYHCDGVGISQIGVCCIKRAFMRAVTTWKIDCDWLHGLWAVAVPPTSVPHAVTVNQLSPRLTTPALC